MIQPDLETSLEALTQRVDVLERRPVARTLPQAEVRQPTQPKVEEKQPKGEENPSVQKEPVTTESIRQKQVEDAPAKIIKEVQSEVSYESATERDHDDAEDLWEDVLNYVKNEKVSAQVLLSDGRFEGIIDNAVTISYGDGYGFHLIAIDKPDNKAIIERGIHQIFGQQLRVKFIAKNQEEENSKKTIETDEEKLYNFLGEHKNKLEFQD